MSDIRLERVALAYGQMIGQLSELLNNIKNIPLTNDQIYKSLLDITNASSIYAKAIYYEDKK